MAKRQAKTKKSPASKPAPVPRRTAAPDVLNKRLLVVGVGASAGGLAAISELIEGLSLKNMALVIVQHLAPDHESMLTEILGRKSSGRVVTATEGVLIQAGFVYVIPPNAHLRLEEGRLRLTPRPSGRGTHLPVDLFFESLGENQGSDAVGVVLSGTGLDGTRGFEAIKIAGGVTFAQRPESASHEGMPQSALSSGNADFSLAPAEIGAELMLLSQRTPPKGIDTEKSGADPSHYHHQLFALIRRRFNTNLALYKIATIERRLARRMTLCKLPDLRGYVEYVRGNEQEIEALHREMLISVTHFFRVPSAFDALREKLRERWPNRLGAHQPPLRVWIPGCATGEEAYSIAILISEEAERTGVYLPVQIFATDIDDQAISVARRGMYGAHIAAEISPERLNRHFLTRGDGYTVSAHLRDMIVFSRQDVLLDPPFPRIDLVSCRNLLIYFKSEAQRQCLRSIHYAMKDDGCLLLGASEGVRDVADLFRLLDPKNKIYGKRPQYNNLRFSPGAAHKAPNVETRLPARQKGKELPGLADNAILQTYVYPGAIVDGDFRILHFRGDTGPYLSPLPGAASLNILKLVRNELHIDLSQTIKKARVSNERVTSRTTIKEKHALRNVTIDVMPLCDAQGSRFLLVLFHQSVKRAVPTENEGSLSNLAEGMRVRQLLRQVEHLEKKLSASHEYLQGVIEEKESANEELKASAEEMQASNEELQSANEELETSREEMQSANEELTTVNEELQTRIAQLAEVNDDLHNVMAGVDNAVFIISLDLTIRRFTHAAKVLFGYDDKDAGRSIRVLESFTGDCDLVGSVSRVIQTLSIIEREIFGANRRWYLLRIVPYKTFDHSIRGAVISVIDQDVQKRIKQHDFDVANYAKSYLAGVFHPHLIIDKFMRTVFASDAFYTVFQLAPEETIGSTFAGHISGNLSDGVLHGWLADVLRSGEPFLDRNFQCQIPDVGLVNALVSGECIEVAEGLAMVLLIIKIDSSPAKAKALLTQ